MQNARNPDLAARAALGAALIVLLVLGALLAAHRPPDPEPHRVAVSETRSLMSTWVTITVVGTERAAARRQVNAAFSEMARLATMLNAHDPHSELSRLNAAAGGDPVVVSPELYDAVRAGLLWRPRTEGAFDITIAPLLELWKRCGRENRMPTPDEIAAARARLCADRIECDDARRTLRLPDGARLDLGGHGKGFIVQRTADYLRRRGVGDALIAASGDMCALGRRADGGAWVVGVQDPRSADQPAILAKLALSDRAVSTSGNYQRYVVIGGRRHSHIIDPRTGRSADDVAGVTVIGPDAVTTDVLDTALSVLGPEAGAALVERLPDAAACFVLLDEAAGLRFVRTSGFARYETP